MVDVLVRAEITSSTAIRPSCTDAVLPSKTRNSRITSALRTLRPPSVGDRRTVPTALVLNPFEVYAGTEENVVRRLTRRAFRKREICPEIISRSLTRPPKQPCGHYRAARQSTIGEATDPNPVIGHTHRATFRHYGAKCSWRCGLVARRAVEYQTREGVLPCRSEDQRRRIRSRPLESLACPLPLVYRAQRRSVSPSLPTDVSPARILCATPCLSQGQLRSESLLPRHSSSPHWSCAQCSVIVRPLGVLTWSASAPWRAL